MKLISICVFAIRTASTIPLLSKFPASSHLLCMCSLVCQTCSETQIIGFLIRLFKYFVSEALKSHRMHPGYTKRASSTLCDIVFFICFFLNSVLRPFQDYFSSYETGQSVGGRKRENPEKNHLAHPQAELGLSHMWPVRGSNLHQTQH